MRNIVFKGGVVVFILGILLFGVQANIAKAAITISQSKELLAQADPEWEQLTSEGKIIKIDVYQQAINAGMTHEQSLGEATYFYSQAPNAHSKGVSAGEVLSSVQGSGWSYDDQGIITLNTSALFKPDVPDESDRDFNKISEQIIAIKEAEQVAAAKQADSQDESGAYLEINDPKMIPKAQAQTPAPCAEEGLEGVDFLVFHGPLVPCGVNKTCSNSDGKSGELSINQPCTLCHFIILIKNVFDLLLSLIITASLLMLTIAGVMYIVSSGGQLTGMAKGIIEKTILGFGIFLLSWLFVYTLLNMLSIREKNVLGKGTESTWFQFECDTKSSFYPEKKVDQNSDDDAEAGDDGDDDAEAGDDGDDDATADDETTYTHSEVQQQLQAAGIGVTSSGNCSDQNNSNCRHIGPNRT